MVAHARLDHHDAAPQQAAGRAAEGHVGRGGAVRRAAAAVAALAAVAQLEGDGAGAALVQQPHRSRSQVAGHALALLLRPLGGDREREDG